MALRLQKYHLGDLAQLLQKSICIGFCNKPRVFPVYGTYIHTCIYYTYTWRPPKVWSDQTKAETLLQTILLHGFGFEVMSGANRVGCRASFFHGPKPVYLHNRRKIKTTMKKQPWMKMNFLWRIVIFHYHVSLLERKWHWRAAWIPFPLVQVAGKVHSGKVI